MSVISKYNIHDHVAKNLESQMEFIKIALIVANNWLLPLNSAEETQSHHNLCKTARVLRVTLSHLTAIGHVSGAILKLA